MNKYRRRIEIDRDYIVELIWSILGGIALGPGLYAILWWGLAL